MKECDYLSVLSASDEDRDLCAVGTAACDPEFTSDSLPCPSAVTGALTFASGGADEPDLARPGSEGATTPGRSGSSAGREAQAEEAKELPKGLCPDEADRPEGPSFAPMGR